MVWSFVHVSIYIPNKYNLWLSRVFVWSCWLLRWMEQQNNKARGKLKRAEMQRVLALVQRAHSRDPRVKAHAEAERERRRQQKEAKKEQKRARERKIQEVRDAEERKKREKKDAVQAEKDKEKMERKAEKELLRASRRAVRTIIGPVVRWWICFFYRPLPFLCADFVALLGCTLMWESNWSCVLDQVDAEETSLQRSDVDHLCLSLTRDDLESLREKLESTVR